MVGSLNWTGTATAQGAATWCDGATGLVGTISAANSLVGSSADNDVGQSVTALSNGNYVVSSPEWGNTLGAVTLGNGSTGLVGAVSAANSLVGTAVGDRVGGISAYPGQGAFIATPGQGGVTPLTNGNFVVSSPYWNGVRGAVTWGSGTGGVVGTISAVNSLVGATASDSVGGGTTTYGISGPGGVTALSNGNYVVSSPYWNGGEGAATWGNGSGGVAGTVSAANSLVGSTPNNSGGTGGDYVGYGGITALANGNYVISSTYWNGGQGAATWGNGSTGVVGTVSAANSLVGASANDAVGTTVTALTNGNYVVGSPSWNAKFGAATWGSGSTGVVGTVSAANSLVGVNAGDAVGTTVTALANGNYVVGSPNWNGSMGAATWGSGTGGSVGAVSAANSLVGSTPNGSGATGDMVGSGGVTALPDGNYVVASPQWSGGRGAATWADGTSGVTLDGQGTIDPQNSLVGAPLGPPVSNTAGIPAPVLSGSAAPGDGFISPLQGTYYYVITATTATGETIASNEVSVVTGETFLPVLTWAQVPGATGYKIYRSTASGQYTYPIATIGSGAQVSFTDYGGQTLSNNLAKITAGPVPGAFLAAFTLENGGRVTVGRPFTVTVSPAFLTSTLAAGTNVVLNANNDITVSDPVSVTPAGSAGSLTLEAGRSILLNASIATGGGNLSLIANQSQANGVFNPERDPGNAAITMQSGVTLNAGAGTLAVDLKTSTDKTNNGQGVATLLGLTAGSVTLSPATALGVTLNGTTPGDGTGSTFTQTVVTGPINLGGATLSVNDPGSFAIGHSFVILTSTQPIAGTFAGLPEGGIFTSGQTFEVSYQNDQVTLLVIPLITFSPSILPADTTGTAYSQTLTASGGMAPYGNFVVSAGALPAGVTLSASGTLSGTPTVTGVFTFTVRATDSSPSPGPYPGQQTFTLVVTPPGFAYDSATQVLTIGANAFFEFSQATTVDSAGLHTTYTFLTSATDTGAGGVTFSLPDTLLSAVVVNATATNSTAVLIANDTYVGADGLTHETRETAWMRPGGGILYTYDASGNAITFLQLNGFNTSYAYVGRADSAQVSGVTGSGIENIFVTAGNYSYVTGGGQFHLVSGSPNVYGYAANSTDQAWQYDAAGSLDAFVASGNAYSYLSGSDTSGNTFFNVAVGFQVTYGIATHGNAIAYLIDSPGNDVFFGSTTYSYLSGTDSTGSVFNVAEAFSLVYGESFVGGTDFAYNYAPTHNIIGGKWIVLT